MKVKGTLNISEYTDHFKILGFFCLQMQTDG